MADQVSGLQQSGVAAEKLDSNTSLDRRDDIWRRIDQGTLDLLYLSPEGLMQPSMLERLSHLPLALVAIDEAHCVSQWGHDFRPEYRMLGRLAEVFPEAPRLAVTATADARTRGDIRAELRLADALEFVDSFARPELALSAERKRGKAHGRVLELVAERMIGIACQILAPTVAALGWVLATLWFVFAAVSFVILGVWDAVREAKFGQGPWRTESLR
jgi:ATP-dependent DNA helicase RecQ